MATKIPKDNNLRIPGPAPVPELLGKAGFQPMINHRGPIFAEILENVTNKLQKIFKTENDVFIFSASGTGALEASIVNTLRSNETDLGISIGSYGDRYLDMADSYGAKVIRLNFPWGEPADPELIREYLKKDSTITTVIITHNETSTGVTNDMETISSIVKNEFNKLLLVDSVSGLGCIPLPVDEFKCDMVATASQKGFMIPPGLSFLSVSEDAWKANKNSDMPSYYFDINSAKKYFENGQTPWTPALSVFYALEHSLELMEKEGLKNIFSKHESIGSIVRAKVKELGLELLVSNERYASNTVTAVKIPEQVDSKKLLTVMREQFGVVLGGGQGVLQGKIFRIGHMGYIVDSEFEELFNSLAITLKTLWKSN